MDPVRVVLFAYHTFGARWLERLLATGDTVAAVVTHADDPGEAIWFESVADAARAHGLPVHMPVSPNTAEFVRLVRGLRPDLFLSVWYRRLLCPELLAIPRLGAVNLHGSLLPRYRGRSALNWVLVNGEKKTGVTLHYMVAEADAGDIIAQEEIEIDPTDTALTLTDKLVKAGTGLFERWYPSIRAGTAPCRPQDRALATTVGQRRPEDGRVSWRRPAQELYNLIRAVTHPFPGAFATFGGRRLFIWAARVEPEARDGAPGAVIAVRRAAGIVVAAGAGALLLTRLALEGDSELAGDEFAARYGLRAGDRLEDGR